MSKPVERIKALIDSLPEKDICLGYKFLDERNFDSLRELVDSAMYKIRKNQESNNPKEEYLKVDFENLSKLKSEIDTYIIQLELPENDIYDDEYLNSHEIEDEFYW